jgi:hypothetical protein
MEGFRSGSLNEVLEASTQTGSKTPVQPGDPDRPDNGPEI